MLDLQQEWLDLQFRLSTLDADIQEAEGDVNDAEHALADAEDALDVAKRVLSDLEDEEKRLRSRLDALALDMAAARIPIPSDPPPRCSETKDMFGGGR